MMDIPNDDAQNYSFCRLELLDTQLNEPMNQNLIKVSKIVRTTNKETLSLTFGDKCNKQPNVPYLLEYKDLESKIKT